MSTFVPSIVQTNMDMTYSLPVTPTPPVSPSPPFMNVFGPLKKDYCLWFYLLSMIGFILLILALVSGIVMGVYTKKGAPYYYSLIMISFVYGIFYFQNRLLYGMCSKTL
jgi:hypothetical protein